MCAEKKIMYSVHSNSDHYIAMRMNNLKSHAVIWMSHKQNVDWKKQGTKQYILYGYIYIKTQKEKNYSVLLEVRIVETSAWTGAQKTFQSDFLFHNLGASHMGIFSLWKFFKLCIYVLYGFLYVSRVNKKLKAKKKYIKGSVFFNYFEKS